MSLTCSFRDLADQVKYHLVGAKRRASSSHDCRTNCDPPRERDSRAMNDQNGSHLKVSHCADQLTRQGSDTVNNTRAIQCDCRSQRPMCSTSLTSITVDVDNNAADPIARSDHRHRDMNPSPHRKPCHTMHHRSRDACRSNQLVRSTNEAGLSQLARSESSRADARMHYGSCMDPQVMSSTVATLNTCGTNESACRLTERACNTSMVVLSFNQSQCPSASPHHHNTNSFVANGSHLSRNSEYASSSQLVFPPAEFNTRSTLSLVPDLSVPHGEVRSGSLGADTHTCFHFHQFRQPKTRSRKLLNPNWNAPEPIQEQDDLRRMTMSYSGLTTVPFSDEATHSMTVSQELSQPHTGRVVQCQKVYSHELSCAQNTDSIYSQKVISTNHSRSTQSEQNSQHNQHQQRKSQPQTNQITTSQSLSSVDSTRLLKPQPACPVVPTSQSTSGEPSLPVLPTRTTSLLSRTSKYRTSEMETSLYSNKTSRKGIEISTRSNSKSSNGSDQDNGEPSLVNSRSNNYFLSVEKPYMVHTRSQSDVTISKLQCYVNTSDAFPSQESSGAVDLAQAYTQRNEPALVDSENQSNERIQTPEQVGLLSHEPLGYPRCTLSTDDTSQATEESSRTSPKYSVPETPTQTLPVPRHMAVSIQNNANMPNSSSCGILDQGMPMNHASRLLGRMSDKLRDGRLADVILLAGHESRDTSPPKDEYESNKIDLTVKPVSGEQLKDTGTPVVRIPAHRVILAAASDYFAAMFGNEVKEASETEIWIRNVEPHALHTLINYIYTGYLDLQEDTVEDILEAACFLQIVEASQACERYLIKRLHASNCLGMSRLGDQHGCHLLRKKAMKYALEHFTDVAQQPDFLNLSFDELTELLQSDHLRVPNEATVFASCLRWFRSVANRAVNDSVVAGAGSVSLLTRVLKFVRLQQLPARLLAEVLEKEPLFHRDVEAVRMLVSALRSHFAPEAVTHDCVPEIYVESDSQSCHSMHNGSQSAYQKLAVRDSLSPRHHKSAHGVRGAHSSEDCTSLAIQRELTFHKQTPRPSTIGRLWALGGKTMVTTRALQEILEYDPYWNSWRIVGHLPGQRQQCGCIVLQDGRLLVVGGRDELKTLSTVECIYTDELMQFGDGTIHSTFKDERAIGGRGMTQLRRRTRGQEHPSLASGGEESDSALTYNGPGDAAREPDSPKGATSSQSSSNAAACAQLNEYSVEIQPGWNVVSAMATHRHGLGVAVLEGVVYAVGGHDGWSYLNTVERWNGRAKSWSSVTPMAVQRSTVGVTALDGLLYAVGGRDGSACLRTVERFNPHTQHWCFIAPMLHRRGGVGVGAVGGRLYAVGGHNAPPNQPHAMRTASVEVYEPRTDMWTEVACLSSPRDSIAVTNLGTKLYALGGHDGHVYTDRVQVYDPETNQWTDVAPLPSGRAGVAVASRSIWPLGNQSSSRFPYYKADPLA
ncbi:Kelch protein 5 [Fasciola hepatica]|uniref:Kelch protein 5 n=1 Tax=Fasciola hepatica TaxID=6192 RepID=A0A4E0RQS3_FASHE|nr:Kelch protein 5 [Fasciola hepatica]